MQAHCRHALYTYDSSTTLPPSLYIASSESASQHGPRRLLAELCWLDQTACANWVWYTLSVCIYYKYIVRRVIPCRFNSALGIRNELLLWQMISIVTRGCILSNARFSGISQLCNRSWWSCTAKQRPFSGNRTSVTSSAILHQENPI